jgi:hypothetical protein
MQFQERPGRPDIAMARGAMFREQGVDVNQPYDNINSQTEKQQQSQYQRPEMRGPQSTDIDNILSGLKTKTVDIHSSNQNTHYQGDDSVVSISSLKDIQGAAVPKKSRRKNNSSRNTISLDI